MLNFHPVEIEQDLNRTNPLYVGNFFPLKGMWWSKRKQRQGLILSIAVAWFRLTSRNSTAPGFISEEILITSLTKQVGDAKVILERFFEITRLGFNFNDGNKSPTQISPKKLKADLVAAIINIIDEVKFSPGVPPLDKNLVVSSVRVQPNVSFTVRHRLKIEDREDLLPAVNWILKQEGPIKFYYERAGTLLARDKSVWPVKSIETWPGWLRTMLFGRVIDIENAYCQFIMHHLKSKYSEDRAHILNMKYPDLLRLDIDKTNYRIELCRDFIKLDPTEDNIGLTKRLVMALANGSNATATLMTNGSGRSEAVRIVREMNPDLLPSELLIVGDKLSRIAKQFKNAKRELCISVLKIQPSRENQKKIFKMYFDWERESRYKIWEAAGGMGLMLHDGIDGAVNDMSDTDLADYIAQKTSIKVSVDSPETCLA